MALVAQGEKVWSETRLWGVARLIARASRPNLFVSGITEATPAQKILQFVRADTCGAGESLHPGFSGELLNAAPGKKCLHYFGA
jgi:hypothetical protein